MHVNLLSMRAVLVSVILCLASVAAKAQFMDTLHEVFKYHGSIDARLESRNSIINNGIVSVNGVRLGVAFRRKLRIGGGVSWLKTELANPVPNFGDSLTNPGIVRRYKLLYLCYYIDFVFYKSKRWQLSVPIQAGTGMSWNQYGKGYRVFGPEKKYFALLYEPGITVQYKVFKWFGLGTDLAYRFAYSHAKRTGVNLNTPTFSFKLEFWFDQLYFDLFPKSEITKRFGPAEW